MRRKRNDLGFLTLRRREAPSRRVRDNPFIGGKDEEDEAVGMGGDIVEMQRALALLGAALAKREQAAEPAIGGAVRWVGKQARRVVKEGE